MFALAPYISLGIATVPLGVVADIHASSRRKVIVQAYVQGHQRWLIGEGRDIRKMRLARNSSRWDQMRIMPDRTKLLGLQQGKRLCLVDRRTGEVVATIAKHVFGCDLDRIGRIYYLRRVVSSGYASRFAVCRVSRQGGPAAILAYVRGDCGEIAASPNGREVACPAEIGESRYTLTRMDTGTHLGRQYHAPDSALLAQPVFGPNGVLYHVRYADAMQIWAWAGPKHWRVTLGHRSELADQNPTIDWTSHRLLFLGNRRGILPLAFTRLTKLQPVQP